MSPPLTSTVSVLVDLLLFQPADALPREKSMNYGVKALSYELNRHMKAKIFDGTLSDIKELTGQFKVCCIF